MTQQEMQGGQRMNIIQFLKDNDVSVTKFLEYLQNNVEPSENFLITEFLESHPYLQ